MNSMPSFIWLHAAVVSVIQIKSLVYWFSLHMSMLGLRYQEKISEIPALSEEQILAYLK